MVLVRREIFMKYLFDETFRRLEDWELWLRMGLDGIAGALCRGRHVLDGLSAGRGDVLWEVYARNV